MKGIILAGGAGTRLSPATAPISKILLPVYDRPMIYYPLATLMSAGIRDILVITNEADRGNFERTLGDGSQFGVRISYETQYVQRGISDAFIIGREFIDRDHVALILGDNIFHHAEMVDTLADAMNSKSGATVFGYRVPDPERFGVAEFDKNMNVVSLEEKPAAPKSDYAVVGLYFYDETVCDRADSLEPSARGELEITDLNRLYLNDEDLSIRIIPEEAEWIDAGTFESLLESSEYVHDTEKSLGRKILCPEIVAMKQGWVDAESMRSYLKNQKKNEYFKGIEREIGSLRRPNPRSPRWRNAGGSNPARVPPCLWKQPDKADRRSVCRNDG